MVQHLAIEPAPMRPLAEAPSPGMAEVIRLAESHVDPNLILAFIQNSGHSYTPTADEILYLSHLNVPQNVIAALFPTQSAPSPQTSRPEAIPIAATTETAPLPASEIAPPPDANSNVFAEALAPYGNWVNVPEYGDAWQPAVETSNPDWRPYLDEGQWLNSENGWYWQSDYPWGWAPFHYGGWINTRPLGWVWVPGKTWGPAWVSWRSTPSYAGWAPLPPGVSLNVLAQLTFAGHPVSPDYDFGITLSSYVFVRTSRLLTPDVSRHVLPAPRATALAASSAVKNNYSVVNNKVINGGINRSEVAAASRQAASDNRLEPVSGPPPLLAEAHMPYPVFSGMRLPALRGAPPPPVDAVAFFDKSGPMGGFRPGPSERPYYGLPEQPQPPGQNRRVEANRSVAPPPGRSIAPAPSSGGKASK